jgi:protein SCO1/2
LFIANETLARQKIKHKRTLENYQVPEVALINQDGKQVKLQELLLSDKPVFLDFIFTTCTTICPVLSVGFSNFQKELGSRSDSVKLVSVSIDPDYDNPELMKDYLERYGAGPGWDFLTGKKEDIVKVMRAFGVYVPNKMNHQPVIILRAPGMEKWVRIYGLPSASQLMKEYRSLRK